MTEMLVDDLSPLYRRLVEEDDGRYWDQAVQAQRRPGTTATPDDLRGLVNAIAPQYGVDPRLAEAIIGLESSGRVGAVSRKGAQGLMQLMPATQRRFGVADPWNATDNITGGVRYLAQLQEAFPGRLDLQLAAYHAGEGAVKAADGQIPHTTDGQTTTPTYVKTILGRYASLTGREPPRDGELAVQLLPTPYEALRAWWTQGPPLRGGGPATLTAATPEEVRQAQTFARPRPPTMPGMVDPRTLPAPVPSSPRERPMPGAQAWWLRSTPEAPTESLPDELLQKPMPETPPWRPPTWQAEQSITEPEPFRSLGNLGTAAVSGLARALTGISAWLGWDAARNPEDVMTQASTNAMRAGLAAVANVVGQAEQAMAVRLPREEQPIFWDKLMQGIGSSGASIFTGLMTGGSGWAAAIGGGVFEAWQEAGELYRNLVPLVGDQEASRRAMKSFGMNVVLVTMTDRLGIFGQSTGLRHLLNSTITNSAQEGLQYAVERGQMWVPVSHAAAPALRQEGWQQEGDRLVQPYVPKDLREVMLIGAIVGSVMGGAVALALERTNPQIQARVAEEQQTSPDFTLARGLEAAQSPDTPPADVPLPTWQRWAQAVLDLLPEPGVGPVAPGGGGLLTSERGSTGLPSSGRTVGEIRADLAALDEGGQAAQAVLDRAGVSTTAEASTQLVQELGQAREAASGGAETAIPATLMKDAEGRPLKVYHGTSQPRQGETALSLTRSQQVNPRYPDDKGLNIPGLYFSDNPEVATRYAESQRLAGGRPQVLAAYLDMQTPFEMAQPFNAEMAQRLLPALEGSALNRTFRGYGIAGDVTPQTFIAQAAVRDDLGLFNQAPHHLSAAEVLRALYPPEIEAGQFLQRAGYDGFIQPESFNEGETPYRAYVVFDEAQVHTAAAIDTALQLQATAGGGAPPPSVPPVPARPQEPGAPRAPGPTIRVGAEGLTPPRYKTPGGAWRLPLKEMPSQELELLDFIRQPKPDSPYGGIKLAGEELAGDFERFLHQRESGEYRLLNDQTGWTVQHMADAAEEQGFIHAPTKEALWEALDRSISLGQPVYSVYATGTIPLLDDPHVQASYRALLDATATLQARTEEQVGSVRHRPAVEAEAQALIASGQYTLEDIRALFPNTAMNDTYVSALLISLHTMAENMAVAAQAYLDGGERIGSREEASLQSHMALLAELDPYRLGVSAAQARGLGIMNDPNSRYTTYLNALHRVLLGAPEHTMGAIARKIVAARPQQALTPEMLAAHPELLADLFAQHYAMITGMEAQTPLNPLEPGVQLPLYPRSLEWPPRTTEASAAAATDLAAWKTTAMAMMGLPPATQLDLPIPERWMSADDWDRLKTAYDQMREGHRTIGPSTTRWMNDIEWTRLREAYDALRTEQAEGALLMTDLMAPGRGPWRTAAEWQARQQAFLVSVATHASDTVAQRVSAILRPWQGRATQLTLLEAALKSTTPGFEQYFLELYYNALLSNPATHLANFIGNTSATSWVIPERWIAEQFSRTHEGGVERGEAAAMLYGLTHGIVDAWSVAAQSFAAGKPQSGLGREYARPPVVTAEHLGLDPTSSFGRLFDFWFEYIGLPWAPSGGRLPSRLMMAADEFAKMLNYRAELNALAYRDAVRQGYDGPAFTEHVTRIVDSPNLAQIQEAATTFSVVQTFQDAIGPENRIGQALQHVSNISVRLLGTELEFPAGRVLLPFLAVPTKLVRWTMERTLPGMLFRSMREDMQAGGTRADIAYAKVTLGTLAMGGMAALALSGRLVGRAPEDPELRQIFLKLHPENSLYVPGIQAWVGLDRLDPPIGMLAAMVADAVQIAGEVEAPLYEKGIAMLWHPFLKGVIAKSYMRGLSDFFEAASPGGFAKPEQAVERILRYGRRQVAQLLQPSSLMAATARAIDPVEHEIGSFWDALRARVPGWSTVVPARRSLGGEKILLGVGFTPEILANTIKAYSPVKLGSGELSAGDSEILINKMDISKPPRTWSTRAVQPEEVATVNDDVSLRQYPSLTLTSAQYERFAVLAGGNQAEAQALGLELPPATLEGVVSGLSTSLTPPPPRRDLNLDEYANYLVTTDQYTSATTGTEGGRNALMQHAVLVYREMGRRLMLAQDEALRTRWEQTQIRHGLQKVQPGERPAVQQQLQDAFDKAQVTTRNRLGLTAPAAPRLPVGAPR